MFKYFKKTISVVIIICIMHVNTYLFAYQDMLRETATALSAHTRYNLTDILTDEQRGRDIGDNKGSLKTSSAGYARKILKGLKNTAAIIVAAVGFYGGTVVYRDWYNANERDMASLAIESSLTFPEHEMIVDALRDFYLLVEDTRHLADSAHTMKTQIGKIAHIIQYDIIANMDSILQYAQENNIDPAFLSAIILTEQLDMYDKGFIREISTDRLGGWLGRDSSIGLGQVRIGTFKRVCAGMLWPQFGELITTDNLSRMQVVALLEDAHINVMVSALAIAEVRDLLPANIPQKQFDLMLAQAYTSNVRTEVPEPPYTYEQLDMEQYRNYVYAHWVFINKALLQDLLFYKNSIDTRFLYNKPFSHMPGLTSVMLHDREPSYTSFSQGPFFGEMTMSGQTRHNIGKTSSSGLWEEEQTVSDAIYARIKTLAVQTQPHTKTEGAYLIVEYSKDNVVDREEYFPNPYFYPMAFARIFDQEIDNSMDIEKQRRIFYRVLALMRQSSWQDVFWDYYIEYKQAGNYQRFYRDISKLQHKCESLKPLAQDPMIIGVYSEQETGIVEHLDHDYNRPVYENPLSINDFRLARLQRNKWLKEKVGIYMTPSSFIQAIQQLHAIAAKSLHGVSIVDGLSQPRSQGELVNNSDRPLSFPVPEKLPMLMNAFAHRVTRNPEFKVQHPILQASEIFLRIMDMQYFRDGNRRLARLMANYHLMLHGYPKMFVDNEDEYLRVIRFMRVPEELADFIVDGYLLRYQDNKWDLEKVLSIQTYKQSSSQGTFTDKTKKGLHIYKALSSAA
jgi:hypothetical protein